MPKKRTPKRPRDPNKLANFVGKIATRERPKKQADATVVGQIQPVPAGPEKNPAAVALGRLGGLKGGRARAVKLTPERRAAIAKTAAQKRWGKN